MKKERFLPSIALPPSPRLTPSHKASWHKPEGRQDRVFNFELGVAVSKAKIKNQKRKILEAAFGGCLFEKTTGSPPARGQGSKRAAIATL